MTNTDISMDTNSNNNEAATDAPDAKMAPVPRPKWPDIAREVAFLMVIYFHSAGNTIHRAHGIA